MLKRNNIPEKLKELVSSWVVASLLIKCEVLVSILSIKKKKVIIEVREIGWFFSNQCYWLSFQPVATHLVMHGWLPYSYLIMHGPHPMIFLHVTSAPYPSTGSSLHVCLSVYLGVKNTMRCDQKPTDQKKARMVKTNCSPPGKQIKF